MLANRNQSGIRKCMQANRSSGTSVELLFAHALWKKGWRFRKTPKNIFGRPDFALKKYKLAIFVDGDFWHGKNWERNKLNHKSNLDYWIPKIERNMKRDEMVNSTLLGDGWAVLRFWESDIRQKIDECINIVEQSIKKAE